MENLIEKVKKWTCKARELMDKDVEVIQLEQLKEEIASAREELERKIHQDCVNCTLVGGKVCCRDCEGYFGMINEVLGEMKTNGNEKLA